MSSSEGKPMSSRLKSWPMWMFMAIVTVCLLAVGAGREGGPLTQQERIDVITKRLACPTCDGESVFVSQASAAVNIKNEVARQVASGQRDDEEIIAYIEERFGGRVLLVPRTTGFDSLVWVLPVSVLVCSVAGLAAAFRRWQREQGLVPSDDDRAMVARLLAEEPQDHDEVPR